ncbi:UNVERIFIED_CONTAM: hypothetical protein PYX00_010080 [Menopon gallinae]|uniref:C3H1-type domain-containing protein n=1 Tax=Menopon gallinae TaxID=328185 RepID=A0AAW2HDS7_9NEOP
MLPSKGFFKKNDCPFFEKGLCVRPHCHFRHRKKVLNESSPATEVDEVEEDQEAEEALLKLLSDYKHLSDIDKKPGSSSTFEVSEKKEESHDTLFAKLVNQTNTYEKINRHIPCAYTPTPQTKRVEPKSTKQVGGIAGFVNSEKSLELITKARTLLQNYCAENIKKCEIKTSGSVEKKNEESDKSCGEGESVSNDGAKGDDDDAVESDQKVDESSVPTESTDERTKDSHCVPQTSKPADPPSTSTDTTVPESTSSAVPPSETNDGPNDVSELEFISSEIELMKKLLNEDGDADTQVDEKEKQSSEEKENKSKDGSTEKVKESHSHSSSRHSSSSKHKSKSSKSHSSSRFRHSSSHSSRHSRSSSSSSRHHSSSSRHHSSSSSHRKSSHHHHKSSSRHSRDRHKSGHGESSESKKSHRESDNSDSKRIVENHKRSVSSEEEEDEEEEEEEEEDEVMDVDDSLNDGSMYEEVTESSSRKRTNSWDGESHNAKYMSLSTLEDVEDDDPDTVEKECLEIFNSYSEDRPSRAVPDITLPNVEYESTVQAKKRTAHSTSTMADHSALRNKTVKKAHVIKSAQEMMYERYKIAEKARETQTQQVSPQPAPSHIAGLNRPSFRIAAVSNIQQMLQAKKAIQEKINQGLKVNERTTIAQTVSQGSSRVAHVPKVPDTKEKPMVMEGTKQVPRLKRQIYLDKLLVETNKIFPTKGEAAEEAVKLEQEIYKLHSASTAAYHSAFVSLLMKTRRRVASVKGEATVKTTPKGKVSHFEVLSGGKKNFSVIKTKKVDISMLSDKQIYDEMLKCKLTPEELKENGFPMSKDRPGYAVCALNYELKYNEKFQHIKKMTGNRRYCIRCSKLYEVNPTTWKQTIEGPETCSYHPGRKKSGGRNSERVYNCCNSSSTEGCATHVRHVTDCNDYENYPNCVRTLSKNDGDYPGIYALDCEMVYTRLGSELARVTVVNLKKEIVYDTLVKPKYPIECYNTLYSGIEEKMLDGVETTLKDVQAVLLSMFSNKTILIGHSLDSDLRALHLIHDTVVDTSVVYKHEKYFPYKYSLKDLCAKKISKIIQDNVGGHDSAEDAIAALEIMLQYVKEEVARYDSLESYEADRERWKGEE